LIESIAERNFQVAEYLPESGRAVGVPSVQEDCGAEIIHGLCQVWAKPFDGKIAVHHFPLGTFAD
jgi:hypothetical protein